MTITDELLQFRFASYHDVPNLQRMCELIHEVNKKLDKINTRGGIDKDELSRIIRTEIYDDLQVALESATIPSRNTAGERVNLPLFTFIKTTRDLILGIGTELASSIRLYNGEMIRITTEEADDLYEWNDLDSPYPDIFNAGNRYDNYLFYFTDTNEVYIGWEDGKRTKIE